MFRVLALQLLLNLKTWGDTGILGSCEAELGRPGERVNMDHDAITRAYQYFAVSSMRGRAVI